MLRGMTQAYPSFNSDELSFAFDELIRRTPHFLSRSMQWFTTTEAKNTFYIKVLALKSVCLWKREKDLFWKQRTAWETAVNKISCVFYLCYHLKEPLSKAFESVVYPRPVSLIFVKGCCSPVGTLVMKPNHFPTTSQNGKLTTSWL